MAKSSRRKRDGTTELIRNCDFCGSRLNLEVNPQKGVWHCWACHRGGAVADGAPGAQVVPLPPSEVATADPPNLTRDFPGYALAAIEARGFDPRFLIETFDLTWDGDRICWPTGYGYAKRAVLPWQEPKVLTQGVKGLIGYNRLTRSQRVVLTEGDYKAAAIPFPWVGLGIQGTGMTPVQVALLLTHEPELILVMLDGGKSDEADRVAKAVHAQAICCLPGKLGPDDIAKETLVTFLLETEFGTGSCR